MEPVVMSAISGSAAAPEGSRDECHRDECDCGSQGKRNFDGFVVNRETCYEEKQPEGMGEPLHAVAHVEYQSMTVEEIAGIPEGDKSIVGGPTVTPNGNSRCHHDRHESRGANDAGVDAQKPRF